MRAGSPARIALLAGAILIGMLAAGVTDSYLVGLGAVAVTWLLVLAVTH